MNLLPLIPIIAILLVIAAHIHYKTTKNILRLRRLNYRQVNGLNCNLMYYFVDPENNLYSVNPYTWETAPKRGKLLKCSDNSLDKQGNIVNSLRCNRGTKVTVRRKDISFDSLSEELILEVNPRGDGRHFDILDRREA